MENLDNKRVRIKTSEIIKSNKYSNNFIKFIKQNKNTIFTAKLDITNNYITLYSLMEDKNIPKWIFSDKDLEVVDR